MYSLCTSPTVVMNLNTPSFKCTNFCEMNEISFCKDCLKLNTFHAFLHFFTHSSCVFIMSHHLIHACLHLQIQCTQRSAITNLEKPTSNQYYIRSKTRATAEDSIARFDRLEKAHLELQEQHAKSCDNISQMMEMLKILTKEKQSAKTPNTHSNYAIGRC